VDFEYVSYCFLRCSRWYAPPESHFHWQRECVCVGLFLGVQARFRSTLYSLETV
jgi:hypothetical protein